MKPKSQIFILALVATLSTAAGADDFARRPTFGEPMPHLAQLSPEERARLRQRWQELPAQDREELRSRFREQWRELPPEERERQRHEFMQRTQPMDEMRPRERRRQDMMRDDGYGRGYEQRGEREQRHGGPGRR